MTHHGDPGSVAAVFFEALVTVTLSAAVGIVAVVCYRLHPRQSRYNVRPQHFSLEKKIDESQSIFQ